MRNILTRSEKACDDIPDNIPVLVGPPFSIEEAEMVVNTTKSRKVPGADCITAECLKAGGEKMAEKLLKICNAAWHQEKLPTD